ncbi:hypothetical protein [Pyxidicoccus xibeiensis]|uniref:hypothetical protein n=1 Tax=Pyxidicoccus xibeiensis TaxID=2906759 RepID=UPI0020A6DFF6|nr:hypothetical protein [Pyxidicoccus xibeiensis]MCP3138279.1 hypothetical protein [Pyxidicoccus xibeiensis]
MTRGWMVVAVLLGGALGGGALALEPSSPATPPEPSNCDFRLECQLGSHTFSVSFDSPSGECTEDDMRAFVEGQGRKAELPLEQGWYRPIPNLANGRSLCHVAGAASSPVSAFAVDGQRVLVFFERDGRPGYDFVGVALIEAATGKLLDVRQSLGQSKDGTVAILTTPRGYKLRLVREHLKEVPCDCPAAYTDDWMAVEVVNGRIRTRWMK